MEVAQEDIEHVFHSQRIPLKLFLVIRRYMESLPDVEMKVSKTQVSFKTKRQFAWVWLPLNQSPHTPKNSIVLSFSLHKRRVHSRIVEAVEPYPGRWMHHVVITRASDLDTRVRSWLMEAHDLSL